MNNVVSATELKNKASEILNKVIFTRTEMIVERHGKPVAKITPIEKTSERRKADIKRVLDETFGSDPDFPEVTNGTKNDAKKTKRNFMKLAGVWKDLDANKMIADIYRARRDGSRNKKFLANWSK